VEKMKFYTTEQVAELLAVNPKTIRLLIKEQKLEAVKIRGEYRIEEAEIRRFIKDNKTTRPGKE
jgi:excisionase family DNA binding protein